jgi:hypothetical protein
MVISEQRTAKAAAPAGGIGFFEKWLSVWVALCIVAGMALGAAAPGVFEALAAFEVASVNLVVAVLIWAMVYPMMVNVDFASLRRIGDRPKGLIVTLAVNWLIKPFTMAALGVLFFEHIFAGVDSYQVVLVSGEEDNVYVPGYPGGGGDIIEDWEGMSTSGTVARSEEHRFETPKLAAGTYLFEMTGTNDADFYVRVGEAPTMELFDCRPYRWGSNETCEVNLTTPSPIHFMVRGWEESSEYELAASKL